MTIRNSTPIWAEVQISKFDRLARSGHFDVVVVGGGITGLSAAYFLKQAGKKVCLLERDRLGHGDSGHTTAHLTCVTDVRLTQLVNAFGREQAALTWYAGLSALDLIERIVTEHGIACEFHRTPAFLHAALDRRQDETDDLKAEAQLARELAFDVDFFDNVPVVDKPGIRIRDQGKIHATAYLAGLARLVDGDGSVIHEHSEVKDIEADPPVVVANDKRIECDYVVIATEVPLLGMTGLVKATFLQTKLAAYSSYVVSGRLPVGLAPDLSLFDTGNPYYYLRIDKGPAFDRVIFGGNDHKTGQQTDTEDSYRRLEETLLRFLPSVKLDHRWSGQVIQTNDGLPFIGESADRQFVATGFNGNGFTFATLAGLMARDAMLGRDNPWKELFSVDRTKIRGGAWDYFKENLDFPYYLVADRLTAAKRKSPRSIKRTEGAILKLDGKRVACSRDEKGQLHKVSAVCSHMGCLVRWNGGEQTWDCPCHGSRFLPTGEVLAGPAETPLQPIKQPRKARKASKPRAKA